MNFKKVEQVGEKFLYLFIKPTGEPFTVETTKADFDSLSLVDSPVPSHPEGEYSQGRGVLVFDTPSGNLEAGTYYEVGDEYVLSVDGTRNFVLPKAAFTKGSITLE